MRINNEIKQVGYFWLPENENKKLPGTLTIRNGGRIELEVIGLFGDIAETLGSSQRTSNRKFLIKGIIESDGYVTIFDCLQTRVTTNSYSLHQARFIVNRALVGIAIPSENEILFNSFKFSADGIDEWISISGIQSTNGSSAETLKLQAKIPQTIPIKLDNGMDLQIQFSLTQFFSISNRVEIEQKSWFVLNSKEGTTLEEFMIIASKLVRFLCFAINQIVSLNNVFVYSDSVHRNLNNGETTPISIKYYSGSKPFIEAPPRINITDMLFQYSNIENNFEEVINCWLNAYERIGPTINLYFHVQSQSLIALESTFLSLAQALETYHRRTNKDTLMSAEDFEDLKANIIELSPKKYQDWLAKRLEYGNELSLRRRIKDLIAPFKNYFGSRDTRRKLVNDIVITRNYLTHYDLSLLPQATTGLQLYPLCLKMEAILQLLLLKELKFAVKQIDSIIKGNQQLRNKLFYGSKAGS